MDFKKSIFRKKSLLWAILSLTLIASGGILYMFATKAATATDVAPAITCAVNLAKTNKATTYKDFTKEAIYYCYQGAGSTSRLMLTDSKYNEVSYYMGGMGEYPGFSNISSVKPGDFIFYNTPKFTESGTTPVLIGIYTGSGQMVRLNDARTGIVSTSVASTFATSNPMAYKFVGGRIIAGDNSIKSFKSPVALSPTSAVSALPEVRYETKILKNFFVQKGTPGFKANLTPYYSFDDSLQVRYLQNLFQLVGTGKDSWGVVGPNTWDLIWKQIDGEIYQSMG